MACVFCESRENLLYENNHVVAFYDRYPVSKGHVLIVPKRHVESYFDLRPEERKAIDDALFAVKRHLDDTLHPDGINLGMNLGFAAGQTVPHAHLHVIPRQRGDVDDPTGGVRGVIPERKTYP